MKLLSPALKRTVPALAATAAVALLSTVTPASAQTVDLAAAGAAGKCNVSYYGAPGELPPGARTANGEVFNPNALTAAHKTLPFNTRVRVNYQGKTIVVRINDRGPFAPGRCLDLTYHAFGKLANHAAGVINANYRVL